MDTFTKINADLIQKLDISAPRYTSYPTAPVWSDLYSENDYHQALSRYGDPTRALSMYVHLPFCESLCY